jgi:hypothetical protein
MERGLIFDGISRLRVEMLSKFQVEPGRFLSPLFVHDCRLKNEPSYIIMRRYHFAMTTK